MTPATDELDILAVDVRSGRTMAADSADRAALRAAVAPGLLYPLLERERAGGCTMRASR